MYVDWKILRIAKNCSYWSSDHDLCQNANTKWSTNTNSKLRWLPDSLIFWFQSIIDKKYGQRTGSVADIILVLLKNIFVAVIRRHNCCCFCRFNPSCSVIKFCGKMKSSKRLSYKMRSAECRLERIRKLQKRKILNGTKRRSHKSSTFWVSSRDEGSECQ